MNSICVRPIQILLVEDSPSDAQLTLAALKMGKVVNQVSHVEDGVEAMEFLRQEGKYAQSQRPDLILLDLNLPRKDGREVLEEMKGNPDFQLIPVVILTTSQAEQDIIRSYKYHANCYITKPVNFERFLEVVQAIENFWLTVVALPPNK